jgi:hypothetical protein
MGKPVSTNVVCSDCGLPWDDHEGTIAGYASPDECIRLLKGRVRLLDDALQQVQDERDPEGQSEDPRVAKLTAEVDRLRAQNKESSDQWTARVAELQSFRDRWERSVAEAKTRVWPDGLGMSQNDIVAASLLVAERDQAQVELVQLQDAVLEFFNNSDPQDDRTGCAAWELKKALYRDVLLRENSE